PRCRSRRSKARGMRKSLLKTPHSVRNSAAVPAAALVAAAAPRRREARRSGPVPYTGVPRVRVAVEEAGDDGALMAARVRLLEGFVARTEIADTSALALQWLGEMLGVSQSICLVRPEAEPTLFAVGSYGLAGGTVATYAVSLEDWSNPLVTAFNNR